LRADTGAFTKFGEFTGRTFSAGDLGIQPAQAPRYVIEILDDPDVAVAGDRQGQGRHRPVTAMASASRRHRTPGDAQWLTRKDKRCAPLPAP